MLNFIWGIIPPLGTEGGILIDIKEMYDYLGQKAGELVKYSDKLRTAFRELDEEFTPIFKRAGIFYVGMRLYSTEYDDRYLKIGKDYKGDWGFLASSEIGSTFIFDESRKVIKTVVLNLPEFLEGYKNQLDKTTEEYKIASEMIEAMNNAIKELKV